MTKSEAETVVNTTLEWLGGKCGICGSAFRHNFTYGETDPEQVTHVRIFCPSCQTSVYDLTSTEVIQYLVRSKEGPSPVRTIPITPENISCLKEVLKYLAGARNSDMTVREFITSVRDKEPKVDELLNAFT